VAGGALDSGWDDASFEPAMLEAPNGEERSRLVGDLIRAYFSAYRTLAGSGESYVSLNDGRSIMSGMRVTWATTPSSVPR
jgi:hypothetical protein